MKKSMIKNKETAITLIALVITIVILLILAGITIRAITRDESLIKTTDYAKEETNKKTAEENIKMKILEIQMDKNGDETFEDIYQGFAGDDKFDIVQVSKQIAANSSGVEWTEDIDKIYVISKKYSKYIFEINRKLEVRLVTLDEIMAKLDTIEITKAPNKVDYYIGETFSGEGMVVKAHYTDGTTKEVEGYIITQTGTLDGTTDEIEVMYEEDGITKTAIQKINISGRPYTVTVSEITTTGFNIGLSLTEAETSEIESIRYYINDSTSGTNYQTTGTVTGLSDYTKKYVWAEVTYNSGKIKKSSNYRTVYTAHSHSSSCYTYSITSKTYYACKYSATLYFASYKTTVIKAMCNACGTKDTSRVRGYIGGICSSYYNETKDIYYDTADCHVGKSTCYALYEIDYDPDSDWTEKEYTVYPKCCPYCISNIFDNTASSETTGWKCCHYLEEGILNCTKSTSGSTYNYSF